ncbi:MAG TPA: Holliday junction resolvase RuvX [Candidatus Angelobacter sp.]|nr:Holliday junction resolvase RuvX [Candidatus Angelobacter sp.]
MSSQLSGRILALDVGSRTIGLAVSDPLGITAQGLETLRRKNKRTDFEQLRRAIAEYAVREIVVGYPLHMSGDASRQSERVSEFAEELRKRFNLPVHLWDERLTSTQANRLLRETEMSIRRRAEVVDRLAAVLILQAFLESRQSAPSAKSSQEGPGQVE